MYLETFAAQRASKSTFVESEERLHGAAQASVGAAGDARHSSRHSSQTEQERADARTRDAVSHIANSAKQRRGGLYAAGARGGEAGVCWPCLGRVWGHPLMKIRRLNHPPGAAIEQLLMIAHRVDCGHVDRCARRSFER